MFGATQAAKRWSRKMQKKDIAIGERRGRRKLIAELRARAAGNPTILKIIDAVEADRAGEYPLP